MGGIVCLAGRVSGGDGLIAALAVRLTVAASMKPLKINITHTPQCTAAAAAVDWGQLPPRWPLLHSSRLCFVAVSRSPTLAPALAVLSKHSVSAKLIENIYYYVYYA